VVVSEGREFLAGEEMANILVMKKYKNPITVCNLNNPSSNFF
jgi:hypothetical protein